MSTAVVVGGGVSGLSALYYLQRSQKFAKIILVEGKSRVGGWIRSTRCNDGAIFEHGPRSFRPAGASGINTVNLVEELGLSDQVIAVQSDHPATQYRYIYVNGERHPLPNGLRGILRKSPPFSNAWIWSILKEPFRPKCPDEDESIDSFVKRRLDPEIAEYAIDAMCRGIYAGNTRELSIRSCFPPIHKFEMEDGSIMKGALRPSKGREILDRSSDLAKRAKAEKWPMWSLLKGSNQLTDSLVQATLQDNRVEIRKDCTCTALEFNNGKLTVKTDADAISADHVFAAIYAPLLAQTLPGNCGELKVLLSSIPAVTVAVVNLEYEGNILSNPGFGHLLPSSEDGKMLGVVYDSCVFPEHDRQGPPTTRLTAMMGGAWFDDLVMTAKGNLTEDFLRDFATETIQTHLGDSSLKPVRVLSSVLKDCIPQYRVGHWRILEQIDQLTRSAGLPLSYLGSSYRGLSVNDCIYNAKLGVEQVTQS